MNDASRLIGRVLVTGATGFVGHTLGKRMVLNGWHVRGTVRSVEQVAKLPAGIEVVPVKSIGVETNWSDALAGVNTVVHLAARVHVMKETSACPLQEFRTVNVAGTEQLARMAEKAGVRRFVFLSSVGVNGNRTHGQPFTEVDKPCPYSPYTQSKFEAEQVLLRITSETGMEVVIIRPPLVYGTGNPGNFLQLLNVIAKGWPLPFASIKNLRSFIFVENLVDAIVTCINHPKAAVQTYLVSDGEDISTPELIRKVSAALGRPARLFPFPPSLMRFTGKLLGKSDAVERLVGSLTIDSSKIQRELGWKPPYTMEQGLKETAEWYKRQL